MNLLAENGDKKERKCKVTVKFKRGELAGGKSEMCAK